MVRRRSFSLSAAALGGSLSGSLFKSLSRPVPLVLALALPLVLGGCGRLPGAFSTDMSDYAAAERIWQDPWVAPDARVGVAGGAWGSNGEVDRFVGSRTTPYTRSVRLVAGAELAIAEEAGWLPTSSTCGENISIALAGPADAVASLVVEPSRRGSVAAVRALTPHHLDDDWSVPDVVTRTCLSTGDQGDAAQTYVEPRLGSEPLRSSPLPDQDEVSWRKDELSAADATLLDEVSADLVTRDLPAVPTPTLDTGVNRRSGAAMQVDVDSTTLTELSKTLDGWDLTFTACGGGGPIRATYVGSFEHGSAVVSATLFDGANTLTVRLPVTEGPPPPAVEDLPPLTASPCFDGEVDALTVLGTPAVLPTDLTPIRD